VDDVDCDVVLLRCRWCWHVDDVDCDVIVS